MKIFLLAILLSIPNAGWSDEPKAPAKPKSKFNAQIYEQEKETESFSAVVKVVREVQGETEVFFEGRQGFYGLSSDAQQDAIVKSQTKKRPIHVEVDRNSRRILKVEFQD